MPTIFEIERVVGGAPEERKDRGRHSRNRPGVQTKSQTTPPPRKRKINVNPRRKVNHQGVRGSRGVAARVHDNLLALS